MPAPTFNTPDGPPQCPHCGGPIRYQERARRDGQWLHQSCVGFGSKSYIEQTLTELGFSEGDLGHDNGLAVLACMNVEGGDFDKAAELSGLDRAFVEEAMQPLIEQGVFKDGTWVYDGDVDLDDSLQCAIQVSLWILCSQKLLVRHPGRSD